MAQKSASNTVEKHSKNKLFSLLGNGTKSRKTWLHSMRRHTREGGEEKLSIVCYSNKTDFYYSFELDFEN